MPALLIPLGVLLLAGFALAAAIAAVEQDRVRREVEKPGVWEQIRSNAFTLFGVAGLAGKAAQKTIAAVISRYAGAKLAALVAWFDGLTMLVRGIEGTLLSYAATTADAIDNLARVVFPNAIATAVKPVGRTARQALREARRGYSLARAARAKAAAAAAAAAAGLTRIRHRVGELDASLRWARDRVRGLTDRVGRISARLSKVEKAVAFAALAGVVVKVLARRFPWLFCRRTNLLGKRVCGMDADYLEALLGTALVVTSALSLAEMARALRGPTGLVSDALPNLIRELPRKG